MVVRIAVKALSQDGPAWELDRFQARSEFPEVIVTGSDRLRALNECKGAVLCAVGLFEKVPDRIEFSVRDLAAEEA